MTTPEIKYFGHAVYSGIRGLSRSKEDWSKLWTLARKIESDIKEIDRIYSENFLLIEESLNENPTAWLDKNHEWQMVYHRLAGNIIRLICLWGYELLPSEGNPELYGKYFSSLKTFEERLIKIRYNHQFSDIDKFEYTQLSAPPLNQVDNIGPTIIKMIDVLTETDLTGDFDFMTESVATIIKNIEKLMELEKDVKTKFEYDFDECARYDDDSEYEEALEKRQNEWEREYYSPEKIKAKRQITDATLTLACVFSNSYLPNYTYHPPEMFRAFFYCLSVFGDQTVKIIFKHPRTDVDTQAINGLIEL